MNFEEVLKIFQKEFESLSGWTKIHEGFRRSFPFENHIEAVKFAEMVSLEAITYNLFPEVTIKYKNVEIFFPFESETQFLKQVEFAKKVDDISHPFREL